MVERYLLAFVHEFADLTHRFAADIYISLGAANCNSCICYLYESV